MPFRSSPWTAGLGMRLSARRPRGARCLRGVGAAYVNLYGRDVTEERRAQSQVLDEKNFTQNILDNLSNGVDTFDTDLAVTMANPAARALLGLEGEVLGRAAQDLWPKNDAIVGQLRRTIATGKIAIVLDHELDIGAEDTISANLTTVSLGAGSGGMLIAEDITQEQRIKGTMVRFMSDSVVERLLDNEEAMLRGTTQEVTIELISNSFDYGILSV